MESLVEETAEPLLVVILGPTGSGKTSLSVALARRFDGEIVSCDSVAVYRGLEIGSAKPSPEQRELVPHYLLDVVDPDAFYTAGDYSRAAREAIAGIVGRGRLPIVTGGTGLHLRALLQGLFPGPQRSAALRDRLLRKAETRGPLRLHRILKRLDPASAARIHANDTPKLIRALEILFATGQTLSATLEGRPDFARDPVAAIKEFYEKYAIPFTADTAAAMRQALIAAGGLFTFKPDGKWRDYLDQIESA